MGEKKRPRLTIDIVRKVLCEYYDLPDDKEETKKLLMEIIVLVGATWQNLN